MERQPRRYGLSMERDRGKPVFLVLCVHRRINHDIGIRIYDTVMALTMKISI